MAEEQNMTPVEAAVNFVRSDFKFDVTALSFEAITLLSEHDDSQTLAENAAEILAAEVRRLREELSAVKGAVGMTADEDDLVSIVVEIVKGLAAANMAKLRAQWQPIETAPNGVRLIFLYPESTLHYGTPVPAYAATATVEDLMLHGDQPTHWMHFNLPAAPESEGRS